MTVRRQHESTLLRFWPCLMGQGDGHGPTRAVQGLTARNANEAGKAVLLSCCVECLGEIGKSLISLVSARNVLQHENDLQNEAETARNPLFAGVFVGDPSRIRTCNPRSRNPSLGRPPTDHRNSENKRRQNSSVLNELHCFC